MDFFFMHWDWSECTHSQCIFIGQIGHLYTVVFYGISIASFVVTISQQCFEQPCYLPFHPYTQMKLTVKDGFLLCTVHTKPNICSPSNICQSVFLSAAFALFFIVTDSFEPLKAKSSRAVNSSAHFLNCWHTYTLKRRVKSITRKVAFFSCPYVPMKLWYLSWRTIQQNGFEIELFRMWETIQRSIGELIKNGLYEAYVMLIFAKQFFFLLLS